MRERRTRVYSQSGMSIGVILSRVVMFVFGVIEALILVRFVLLMLGANIQAGFVQWIYQTSGYFMIPFTAMFGTQSVDGAIIEWSALVAILVYAIIAWLIVTAISALTPSYSSEVVETEEDDRRR
jgi:Ca2+/Na+ antiporter